MDNVRVPAIRRFALIWMGWAFLFFSFHAQGGPRFAVSDSVWDFGDITATFRVGHVFKIKNVGDAPLLIQRVETSCGCAVASLADSAIEPGSEAPLRVTLNAENLAPGILAEKTVTLTCNDPQGSIRALTLRARLSFQGVSGISMEPRWVRQGQGKKNQKTWERIVITNQDMGPCGVHILETFGAAKEARVTRRQVPKHGRTVLKVFVDRRELRERPKEGNSVTLSFRGDGWEERGTLPVEAVADSGPPQTR